MYLVPKKISKNSKATQIYTVKMHLYLFMIA